MFNKGKPYVPPPTRSMGTTSPHENLHDLDDAELELEDDILETETEVPSQPSYSHAAEERLYEDPDDIPVETTSSSSNYDWADSSSTAATSESSFGLSSGGSGLGSGGSSGGGSGSGSGGGSFGGGFSGSPPSPPTQEAESVLGNGMTFEGDISGVGQLVIEGTVKGDVRVSQVLINEKGSVEGTIHADVLDIRGTVTGAIVAKQVRLHPSSKVDGDITQEEIVIERGAWFSGRSTQAKRSDDSSTD